MTHGDQNFTHAYDFNKHLDETSGIAALTSNVTVAAVTGANLAKYGHTSGSLYSGVVLMFQGAGTYSGSVAWVKI
jgi:hypothetical protein